MDWFDKYAANAEADGSEQMAMMEKGKEYAGNWGKPKQCKSKPWYIERA